MNISANEERSGRYGLDINITKKEIKILSKVKNLNSIQFVEPVQNNEVWKNIETYILSKRPDIELRVYGHYSQECDLSFLQYVPSTTSFLADCLTDCKNMDKISLLPKLKQLIIGVFNISSFDFLNDISKKLTHLSIGETKSTSIDVSNIKEFQNLESFYNDGMKKGLENIKQLKQLKKITLRGVKLPDLKFLSELKKIEILRLLYGSYKNLDLLSQLKNLKELELSRVRQIPNYDFLNSLVNLEQIEFEGMSKLTAIPNLSKLENLKILKAENNLRLDNLDNIRNIPNLRAFKLIFSESSKVKEIQHLLSQLREILMESTSIKYVNRLDSFDDKTQEKLGKKGIDPLKWDTII